MARADSSGGSGAGETVDPISSHDERRLTPFFAKHRVRCLQVAEMLDEQDAPVCQMPQQRRRRRLVDAPAEVQDTR